MPIRLIDANDLKMRIQSGVDLIFDRATESEFIYMIDSQPAIEAEPVRHGHWIWLEPYGALFTHRRKCSECGDIKAQEESNFCPNCGTKMDGCDEA